MPTILGARYRPSRLVLGFALLLIFLTITIVSVKTSSSDIERLLGYTVDWKRTGDCVTALATALAAVTALLAIYWSYKAYRTGYHQLKILSLASHRDHRHNTSLSSLGFLQEAHAKLFPLYRQIVRCQSEYEDAQRAHRARADLDSLSERLRGTCSDFLLDFEMFALAVNAGVVDIGFANDYIGSIIEDAYTLCAPLIRARRAENPAYYRQIEFMLDDLLALRRAKYIVSRAAVAKLKADLIGPGVLDVLRKAPFVQTGMLRRPPRVSAIARNREIFDRAHLEALLHRQEISSDKYSIYRHTMVREFDVRKAQAVNGDQESIVRMLRQMYNETKGQYPLTIDDDSGTLHDHVARQRCCRRWLAVQTTEVGEKCVGHVSVTDLGSDTSHVWKKIFGELDRRGDRLRREAFVMIQELHVAKDTRNCGIARMLLRRAIRDIEENVFPAKRLAAQQQGADRPRAQLALTVVKHDAFPVMMETVYKKDGGLLIGGVNGEAHFDVKVRVAEDGRKKQLAVSVFRLC